MSFMTQLKSIKRLHFHPPPYTVLAASSHIILINDIYIIHTLISAFGAIFIHDACAYKTFRLSNFIHWYRRMMEKKWKFSLVLEAFSAFPCLQTERKFYWYFRSLLVPPHLHTHTILLFILTEKILFGLRPGGKEKVFFCFGANRKNREKHDEHIGARKMLWRNASCVLLWLGKEAG